MFVISSSSDFCTYTEDTEAVQTEMLKREF